MARVKRGVHAAKKRRTTLERASGYRGQRSRLFTKAKEQVTHSLVYAFNDRKDKKGDFRQLWITRINAATRANGMTYNRFIQGLKAAGVEVDRRVLSDLATNDPAAFTALVEVARKNVSCFETLNETVVCHSISASGCIDTSNPQLAEVALLILTIVESVNK